MRSGQIPDIYFSKDLEPRIFFFFLIKCRAKEKTQIDAQVFGQSSWESEFAIIEMVKTAKGIGLGGKIRS